MVTVQIAESTRRELLALSEQTGLSVQQLLEKAVEDYRRKVFFEGVDRDFAALKGNPEAWAEELEERRLLDNTLMDGIDSEELWPDHDRRDAT